MQTNNKNQQQLPLGFSFALSQDPVAMQVFSTLPDSRRNEVLQQARSATSKAEMQALVHSLSLQG